MNELPSWEFPIILACMLVIAYFVYLGIAAIKRHNRERKYGNVGKWKYE